MLPHGIIASTVTPTNRQGELALNQFVPQVEWLLHEGVDGLSPLGSSGEFAAFDVAERKQILESLVKVVNGRTHIMAGVHHYSTARTIELARHAQAVGADSLLITPPYYMVPTLPQVMDHYRAIAARVSVPIVLYHTTVNTAVDLGTRELVQLFEEKAISGVKMSNAQPDRIASLLQATHGQMTVYVGLDLVAFEGLCHGAQGWISGIPSFAPRAARRLYDAIRRDDLDSARAHWNDLAALAHFEFQQFLSDGNGYGPQWFSVMKAALNMLGVPVGDPILPIQPLSTEDQKMLRSLLIKIGCDAL